MKNDARKLSTEEQHSIRKLTVQRVHDGESPAEVTRSFRLGKNTIFKNAIFTWLRIATKACKRWRHKARTDRNRKLFALEEQEVKWWIVGGDPRQYGFDFGLWTRQIVSDLIRERFGIELSVTSTGDLLLHQIDNNFQAVGTSRLTGQHPAVSITRSLQAESSLGIANEDVLCLSAWNFLKGYHAK